MSTHQTARHSTLFLIIAAVLVAACGELPGDESPPEPSTIADTPDTANQPLPTSCHDIEMADAEMRPYVVQPGFEPYTIVCFSGLGGRWALIGTQYVWRAGQRLFDGHRCESVDQVCYGSVHPDAVDPDRRMDLLFLLDSSRGYVIIRGLPPIADKNIGLANVVTLDWLLPDSDQPAFAGDLAELDPGIEVEVNGELIDITALKVHVRMDGIWLFDTSTSQVLLRTGFPSSVCAEGMEIAGSCSSGRTFYATLGNPARASRSFLALEDHP